MKEKSQRFKTIDALRGIAALLVVWHHTSDEFIKIPAVAAYGTGFSSFIDQIDFGRIGIVIFFLISGFVIPSSLKRNKNNAIKHFAIRRVFRLYPAYWLSLIGILIYYSFIKNEVSLTTIIANITLLQGFISQPHLIGLYWTLHIELVFYLLCVLLFSLNRISDSKLIFKITLFLLAIFIIFQGLTHIQVIPISLSKDTQLMPYMLSLMFLGTLYRRVFDKKDTNKMALIATSFCLGLPIVLLVSSLLNENFIPQSFKFGFSILLAFILFFLGIKYLKNASKHLIWLGTISYSVYLFHPIIVYSLVKLCESYPSLQNHSALFFVLITSLITILFASIIYLFIEKPSINLSYHLTQKS